MTEIQLNSAVEPQFFSVTAGAAVRSTEGKVIGQYLPQEEYVKMLYASYKCDLSEEEWQRRLAETGGCSLEEIWKQLGVK
jgi:hypothetical protein